MVTTEEIELRIKEADSARSARRTAAAKRVGELASRRAAVAEQLNDLERELGDVLAESSDVIEIHELARFTDVPAADLTRWLDNRKVIRPKRKRVTTGTSAARGQDGPRTVRSDATTDQRSAHAARGSGPSGRRAITPATP
jgi:hypothetical protein